MRTTAILLIVVLGVSIAHSEEERKFDTLTTKSGRTYTSVTVREKTKSGIKIFHEIGAATIPFEELPDDVAKDLGGFDEKAAKAEREAMAARENALYEDERRVAQLQQANENRYANVLALIRKCESLKNSQDKEDRELGEAKLPVYKQLYEYLKQFPDESDATINHWVDAVVGGSIVVNMPTDLVIMSWGKPDKINSSSRGADQWIYRRAGYSAQYLYIANGRVESFNES